VRAWDIGSCSEILGARLLKKPVIVAPAMNTNMWQHPFTKKQIDILSKELGFYIIDPIEKLLMCGDKGMGAMASIEHIIEIVKNSANLLI
jgi:phosphopantothenoylcysteine decarboxylase